MDIQIEEVRDLEAAWPDLTVLFLALEDYNRGFLSRRLRHDWEQRWRDHISLGADRLILVTRVAGEAVGCLDASVVRDHGLFDEVIGYVSVAFVRPDLRAKGVGQAMFRRAEDWCAGRGAREIRLDVYSGNNLGMRFWTLSGFEPYSVTMRKSLTGRQG